MKAIVNVDSNWGIGYNNQLLCSFSEDLSHFKDLTIGKAIVYGRKTLLSFPDSKPLQNRTNIVISSSRSNIPEIAKKSCDYYCYIKNRNLRGKSIALTGITFNKKTDTPSNYLRTTLALVDNIDLVEDVGMFLGHPSDDIIVCGGESIYKQLLDKCTMVYVTKNSYVNIVKKPDTYFPNLDNLDGWKILSQDDEKISLSGIKYKFLVYGRI